MPSGLAETTPSGIAPSSSERMRICARRLTSRKPNPIALGVHKNDAKSGRPMSSYIFRAEERQMHGAIWKILCGPGFRVRVPGATTAQKATPSRPKSVVVRRGAANSVTPPHTTPREDHCRFTPRKREKIPIAIKGSVDRGRRRPANPLLSFPSFFSGRSLTEPSEASERARLLLIRTR